MQFILLMSLAACMIDVQCNPVFMVCVVTYLQVFIATELTWSPLLTLWELLWKRMYVIN